MAVAATVDELREALLTRTQLLDHGWFQRDVDAALRDGRLHRVRRHSYMDGPLWRSLWPESRHLAEVLASANQIRTAHAGVSHASAAVLRGLPLYRYRSERVHVTVCGSVRSSTTGPVQRHLDRLDDSDVTQVGGILCTTLERTVFDVARTLSAEAAISCADAALRSIAVRGQRQDEAAAEAWLDAMSRRAAANAGSRGIVQARRIIDLADGRAQLPGESVSRLQLIRLGFARPRLQVALPAPGGSTYWVDFGLDDVNAFGEFDGRGKYIDDAITSGRSVEDVVLDEKRREDWIRGVTQRRFVRWENVHIASPEALRQRLAAFHVHPPRR